MSDVRLVPVVELFYYSDTVKMPETWASKEEWSGYRDNCFLALGLNPIEAYDEDSRSWLYALGDVTDEVVAEILRREILNNEDEDTFLPLDGGYVLQVDKRNLLFPQCCGDLGDIDSWHKLIFESETKSFWHGHPNPTLQLLDGGVVRFDLETSTDSGERFSYEKGFGIFDVCLEDMKSAFVETEKEVERFRKKLLAIDVENRMGIGVVKINQLVRK